MIIRVHAVIDVESHTHLGCDHHCQTIMTTSLALGVKSYIV